MKRILFFDIDGTIAISGKGPSRETVQAIRSARAAGHKVFLSTGRTEHSVPDAIHEIGFDGGIYSAGGHVITDGKVILDCPMALDMKEKIISALERTGFSYTLECANANYTYGPDLSHFLSADSSDSSSELQRILLSSKKGSPKKYGNDPLYKVSFLARSQGEITNLATDLDDSMKIVTFENMNPGFPCIAGEISDKHINKGIALERICAYWNIDPKWSIAFGDSMNDAEMLMAAGIGVAMGNADEQVKELADQVCESCMDNGVSKTMVRLGLAG